MCQVELFISMRKLIPFLLLFSLVSCSKSKKPEGIVLKVLYQPENTYKLSTIRGTETVVSYSGQEIAMRKLKSMGVNNPTISKVRTKTDAELVTGKRSIDSSFQVSLNYKKIMSLDGKNEIPEGTLVQGEIRKNEQPTFKSVVSNSITIDKKAQLLQTLQNTFDQFNFPEQRLKIGDQFSTDRQWSMPMENSEIDIVVTTTFKLLAVKNNTAEFELNQSYLMTPKILDNSFSGKGTGNGKLSYDIANYLISDYSVKTELDLNKKLDYYEFDLKTINEFSQQTVLMKK